MSARAKTGPRRLVPRINVGCCFGFVMMVSFTYATVDGCRCRRSHFTPDSWRGSSKRGLLSGPTHLNFSPETDYHFDSYRAVWQEVSGCFIAVWSKFHLLSGKLSITWLVSRLL